MTRERRAIDTTTTASTSSLSVFFHHRDRSISFETLSRADLRRRARSPADSHLSRRRARSVNWLKCVEISKILSTWLETCKFLAKVGQTLRVGSVSTVDFFLHLVIYSAAPGKFRTVAREPRWSKGKKNANEGSSFRRLLAARTWSEGVRVTRDKLQEGED